jgi:hypothetical protein
LPNTPFCLKFEYLGEFETKNGNISGGLLGAQMGSFGEPSLKELSHEIEMGCLW